ncbi:MAG: pyridoxal-phosphate dependent enzyme [Ignavibacteriaceae bacterium]|nr:pyridoxal-phosphate dependent enzyme [Ignavibacteriaceae bacterium]MCU0412961.1 pyridoxal-phosphate dependent enzyme [Ignavibacteriaceae bacterium]
MEKVNDPLLKERKISLFIKREDLNHPHMSGNKWHKLKYNLQEARKQGKNTLLTFGGAYSNHIYATAAAGKIFNFNTIGIIRGEEHLPLNPTLSFAKDNGMQLYYLDRTSYRNKNSLEVISQLQEKFGDFYLVPEGGTNELAVKGCREIIKTIDIEFDYICCPCGTSGTLAGLISGLQGHNFALGFAVLKGASFLKRDVGSLLKISGNSSLINWDINLDYHFGGYAKFNSALMNFISRFTSLTKIPIEPIYTGKMLFGIYDLIAKDYFNEGSRIVALHTGGLQGLRGLSKKSKRIDFF